MVRPLIVTGAGGRIGRLLRLVWRRPALWLTRAEWEIEGPAPDLPQGAVILDLAGVTRGDFGRNPALADRLGHAAAAIGAQVIHVSSASVYPGGAGEMAEDTPLAPPAAYGASKARAEDVLRAHLPGVTVLRLCNIAGADAILGPRGKAGSIVLDPVPEWPRGPVRSYIGPQVLARALGDLCDRAMQHMPLPLVMNLSQPGSVAMGDLLDAAGLDWSFGPPRSGVVPRVVLSTDVQARYLTLPSATAASLVVDLRALRGWP